MLSKFKTFFFCCVFCLQLFLSTSLNAQVGKMLVESSKESENICIGSHAGATSSVKIVGVITISDSVAASSLSNPAQIITVTRILPSDQGGGFAHTRHTKKYQEVAKKVLNQVIQIKELLANIKVTTLPDNSKLIAKFTLFYAHRTSGNIFLEKDQKTAFYHVTQDWNNGHAKVEYLHSPSEDGFSDEYRRVYSTARAFVLISKQVNCPSVWISIIGSDYSGVAWSEEHGYPQVIHASSSEPLLTNKAP